MVLREESGWNMHVGAYDFIFTNGPQVKLPTFGWHYVKGNHPELQIHAQPHNGKFGFIVEEAEIGYEGGLKNVISEIDNMGIEMPDYIEEVYGHILKATSYRSRNGFLRYCIELRAGWERLIKKKTDYDD